MSEWFSPSSWFSPESWFDSEATPDSGGGASFSGDVEIKIALGSFTVEPFLWPHLADKITATWGTNVDSCRVYLEGADGSRVLLNDNQSGTAKYRPAGQSTEYAGSWAQDYGAGAVTDTGTDYGPTTGGVSSSVMGDPHRATAFQMLADRTATYLVFVVTPTDPSAAVEIQCPLLEYTKASQRKHVWENAHQVAVIHPNGAGVRAGIFNSGTSGTLNNPPSLYDPSERPNTIDWLVTERLLIEGIAHDSGLTTELVARYDTFEGQSVGQVRNNSHAFLLPPSNGNYQLALVNSMAEAPPIGHFPRRERGTTWEADGDPVQHVWVAMQEPDYFVNPSQSVQLRTDDDSTVWTGPSPGVPGWEIVKHAHAVANNESDFGVWLGGVRYAELRPFRGHYSVLPLDSLTAWPWNLVVPWGHFYRAQSGAEGIRVKRKKGHHPGMDWAEDALIGNPGDIRPTMFWHSCMGAVSVVFERLGVVLESRTLDDGRTWSIPEEIMPGRYPTSNASGSGWRIRAAMEFDSGDSGPGKIVLVRQGPGDATPAAPVYATDETGSNIKVEEGTFHIYPAGDARDLWVLTAVAEGEIEPAEWVSTDDGLTYKRV